MFSNMDLTESNEIDRKKNLSLGIASYQENDFDQAQHHFEEYEKFLLENGQEIPVIHWNLGMTHIKQNELSKGKDRLKKYAALLEEKNDASNYEALIKTYKQLIKLGDPIAHFNLGKIYFKSDQYSEALVEFAEDDQLLKKDIWRPLKCFMLAQIYFEQGMYIKAKKNLKKYLDHIKKSNETNEAANALWVRILLQEIEDGDLDAHFELGEHYFNEENYDKAEEHLLLHKNYLDENDEWHPIACRYLGVINYKKGNYAQAREYLEKYINDLTKDGSNNSKINELLINIYKALEAKAEEEIDSNHEITELVLKTKDKSNAIKYFDIVTSKKPFGVGNLLKQKKQYGQAILAFEKSIQNNHIARIKVAEIYYDLNNKRYHAKFCLKNIYKNKHVVLVCLGDMFHYCDDIKDYQKAEAYYQQYLQSGDTDPHLLQWVHLKLGEMYEKGGPNLNADLDRAITEYSEASKKGSQTAFGKLYTIFNNEPDNTPRKVQLAYTLGTHIHLFLDKLTPEQIAKSTHRDQFNLGEVQRLLELAANVNHPDAQLKLAAIHERKNEEKEAISWYQKAVVNNKPEAWLRLGEIELGRIQPGQEIKDTQVFYQAGIDNIKKAVAANVPDAQDRLRLLKNQLITALMYAALRYHKNHKWNLKAPQCKPYIDLLVLIDAKYKNYATDQFNKEIEAEETAQHTFFGMDLSDDSDVEDEKTFQKSPVPVKQSALIHSSGLFKKAEIVQAKKVLQNILGGKEYKTDAEILKPEHKIGKSANPSDTVVKDLRELNYWRDKGQLAEGLKRTTTRFAIAEYRGITYKVTSWNQAARRKHRNMNHTGVPLFSASVHKAANVPFDVDYKTELQSDAKEKLHKHAKDIKKRLLDLRKTKAYHAEFTQSKGKKRKRYEFDNVAHFLQDTYTKDYDKFFTVLKKQKDLEEGKEEKNVPPLELVNAENPFVSTGDIPLHALKYAYGIKPYQGHRHERLRPRWRKEGKDDQPEFRAERPFSGKVFMTLHTVEEYDKDNPLHVVSLNHLGQVRLDSARGRMILPERETTFPAYIPENRVVYTHTAKYPSFKNEYNEIYAVKYGMDKELYDLYREALKKYPPHSKQLEMAKILMGEYLCHYHQFRLVEQAGYEAEQRGAVLVYLDEFGKLSLNLPPIPSTRGKDQNNIVAIREQRISDFQKNKEKKRESKSSGSDSDSDIEMSSADDSDNSSDNSPDENPAKRPRLK